MPYPFVDMTLYFFLYSFCGWLIETIYCSWKARRFINRGFLNGPICPIYGCGVLLMLILLIPVRNNVSSITIALPVIFFAGAVLASTVEYFTSWIMEVIFKARWWDYSDMKFNLNGRICLSISFAWGALATGFLYLVQPTFEALVASLYRLSEILPLYISVAAISLFFIDFIVSVHIAKLIGSKLQLMEKWTAFIREHMESLDLPTKEELLLRLEDLYDRWAPRFSQLQAKVSGENKPTFSEWDELPFETMRRKLAELIGELSGRRDELLSGLLSGLKPLQKRMLKAFPYMKNHMQGVSLDSLNKFSKTPETTDNAIIAENKEEQ